MEGRTYVCIDLKSFYASVELADRQYDPLTTHLVVADETRTEKTICLAVSPSLKACGISGRARLFEVIARVKEINARRFQAALRQGVLPRGEDGRYRFASASFDAAALAADPALEMSFLIAPPRMRLYEEISTRVYSVYTQTICPEDIHVYSIDECFLDVTAYLGAGGLTARELTMRMIREVLYATGITATAGIGTNLYLAKVAMDIVAKHVEPDEQGVRIAALDERSYRELLWCHRPLTDFWRVGRGTAARLAALGCFTMGDIARLSVRDEGALYAALGINAELLIDHAWGWEPTDIRTIKAYRPASSSLTSGQVLKEPYSRERGRLIVREMAELLALDLTRKGLVTRLVTLTVGYDRSSLVPAGRAGAYLTAKTGRPFRGSVGADAYGRPCPRHAHGTERIDHWTNAASAVTAALLALYDRIVDGDLYLRRVNIAACALLSADKIPPEEPEQMDLFGDCEARSRAREAREAAEERERRLMETTVALQERYGKNILLKGMNFLEGGTTRERNGQIGGHRA